MKKLFSALSIVILFNFQIVSAADVDVELEKKYSEELDNTPKINQLTQELSDFAEKKKLTAADKSALNEALRKVLTLEKFDPSRDGAFALSDSYVTNKKMYTNALKDFNKQEQKTLKEVFKVIEHADKGQD